MEKKEIKVVRFDWAMKNILRDKSNFDILEGFLTALLNRNIKVLNILESESNQEEKFDKFNRVDLLVLDDDDEHIIIEIQNQRQVHYLERLLYGTSKVIVENMSLGESFEQVKKVISVSILYFIYAVETDDYVYYGTTELKGIHTHNPFKIRRKDKDIIKTIECKDIFPEYYLIEVEKFQDIINSDLDEWIYFFKNEAVRDDFKSKHIDKVESKLSLINMSKEERKRYERYMMSLASEKDVINSAIDEGLEKGRKEGIQEGRKEGIQEGRNEEKLITAKKMKDKGSSIDFIVEITGLSREDIEKL